MIVISSNGYKVSSKNVHLTPKNPQFPRPVWEPFMYAFDIFFTFLKIRPEYSAMKHSAVNLLLFV